MLGFLHVIAVEAGAKIPTEECLAAPTGLLASLESMPTFGWLQIMLFCCMQETGAGTPGRATHPAPPCKCPCSADCRCHPSAGEAPPASMGTMHQFVVRAAPPPKQRG